ncbi:MAG: hypothetical protein HZB55_20970 [Deltaproteobacteria bacterium]|nr:hypothetical protein [Deltaproteobacteria bacterium]
MSRWRPAGAIALLLLAGGVGALAGAAGPDSTGSPAAPWRLGFSERGLRLLEVPPLDELCEEKDRLLLEASEGACTPETPDLTPVPLDRDRAPVLRRSRLAERRTWWLLDLRGRSSQVTFPHLVALYSASGASGCYFLASEAVARDRAPVEGPTEENLVFAFPEPPRTPPAVRRPSGDWTLYDRAETKLPGRYCDLLKASEVRVVLGARYAGFASELSQAFAQPFSARLDARGRPETLWLVGWAASGPKSGELDAAWSVCRERAGRLQPLAVVYDADADEDRRYRPELVAAMDLDGDGADELVLSAHYGEGDEVKVFAWRGGGLVPVYDSAYFGQ